VYDDTVTQQCLYGQKHLPQPLEVIDLYLYNNHKEPFRNIQLYHRLHLALNFTPLHATCHAIIKPPPTQEKHVIHGLDLPIENTH
jgi:hypothetical protein